MLPIGEAHRKLITADFVGNTGKGCPSARTFPPAMKCQIKVWYDVGLLTSRKLETALVTPQFPTGDRGGTACADDSCLTIFCCATLLPELFIAFGDDFCSGESG
jgi:hypothetical protein